MLHFLQFTVHLNDYEKQVLKNWGSVSSKDYFWKLLFAGCYLCPFPSGSEFKQVVLQGQRRTLVNKNSSGSCNSADGLAKDPFLGECSCMVKGQHQRKGSSADLPWEAPARWQCHTTSLLSVPWADSFHGQLAFTKHEWTSFLLWDWILADKLDRFPEARVTQLCQSH